MHVWLIPSSFYPNVGGVEEVTLQLARYLTRHGHTVAVVTNRHPSDLGAADVVEGIEVHRLRFASPALSIVALTRFLRTSPTSLRAMLQITPRPDVVHVHCAASQLTYAAIFARLARRPLVLTTHGEVDVDNDRLFGVSVYARASLRLTVSAADALTACSAWAARGAGSIAPALGQAVVIANGIDLAQWPYTPTPEHPIVACWGRHVPQKGFDLLLEAWPLVLEKLPTARLLIGGSGPESASLRRRSVPRVDFWGPLDRAGVAEMLRRSRVVVVPSRVEPFGIVALEAMAAGRPVVWSVHGGLGEATGGLGWGVDPEDRSKLADALVEALTSEPDWTNIRRHAEAFSWDTQGARYLEIYERVLRRRSKVGTEARACR